MPELGQLLSLEYGAALQAERRAGYGFPVFGSNGEVGRHDQPLVDGPGIVVGRKGSVGKVCWSEDPFWPIDTTYWVKCSAEQRRWVYWLLSRLPLAELDSSTGVPGLNRNDVYELSVFEPPTADEKSKIAEVLDTLDTTIRQTEAIIEKLKQVKQGLLHDLLTRGIDSNGELRPPQSQAPHLYKDSPLGWIPREWDTRPLGEVIGHLMDYRGRTPKKLGMDWGGGDILALSANNVQMGGIDTSREAYFGGDSLYARWMTNGDPAKSDVLMTLEAPLGNVAQVPDDRRYILSQRVVLVRFNANLVNNDFAFWQLISDRFQRAMVRLSTGTTATGIQRAKLVQIPFAVPPLDEQHAVDGRLRAIERRLGAEEAAATKLGLVKSGLMDDLLTGRVRVTPLLDAAAPA